MYVNDERTSGVPDTAEESSERGHLALFCLCAAAKRRTARFDVSDAKDARSARYARQVVMTGGAAPTIEPVVASRRGVRITLAVRSPSQGRCAWVGCTRRSGVRATCCAHYVARGAQVSTNDEQECRACSGNAARHTRRCHGSRSRVVARNDPMTICTTCVRPSSTSGIAKSGMVAPSTTTDATPHSTPPGFVTRMT